MIIRGPRPESGYVMILNSVARDARLSYRARGLLLAILSRPDDWRTDHKSLSREAREGQDAVRAALAELAAAGYLVRTRHRGADGRWSWAMTIFDSPAPAAAATDVPVSTESGKAAGGTMRGKPHRGAPGVVSHDSYRETKTNDRDGKQPRPAADASPPPDVEADLEALAVALDEDLPAAARHHAILKARGVRQPGAWATKIATANHDRPPEWIIDELDHERDLVEAGP